jgi:hypothetical protein
LELTKQLKISAENRKKELEAKLNSLNKK